MSRSRKKTPGFVGKSTYGKKAANRVIRQKNRITLHKVDDSLEMKLIDGCIYKRYYNQYNVRDWTYLYYSKQSLLDSLGRWGGKYYSFFIK